jgi:hypothetical protein
MIAAYIGPESASEVLSDMQRRQESIFGGFYSGIATCENGRLYRERTIGSFSNLSDAVAKGLLPGTIGIAHSRTNSGGGVSWAQPRLNFQENIATVGNGFLGVLSDPKRIREAAEKLLKTGLTFQTLTASPRFNGVALDSGFYVHPAEVLLEAVSFEFGKSGSLEQAIRTINLRSESVEIYLTSRLNRTLYVINHNQRLVAAKSELGMQVATSRLAFSNSTVWELEIPPNTIAIVNEEEVQVKPLWLDGARYDFNIPKDVNKTFLSYIAQHPGSLWEEVIDKGLYPQFSKKCATLAAIVGHRLFEECLSNRKIKYQLDQVLGLEGQKELWPSKFFILLRIFKYISLLATNSGE